MASDPSGPKLTWTWDKEHIFILGAYVVGVAVAGGPLVAALLAGRQADPTPVALGVATLVLAAVRAFFKKPPQSIEEAFQEGEDAEIGATGATGGVAPATAKVKEIGSRDPTISVKVPSIPPRETLIKDKGKGEES
jgi:hypothetical protein